MRVTAEIETLLALNPAVLNLGEVGRGESVTRTLEVTGKLAQSVNLVSIHPVPDIDLVMTPNQHDGRHFVEIRAAVGAKAQLGRQLNGTAQVHTDSEKVSVLRLSVRANLVGNVYARPARANVRVLPGGPPAQLHFDVLGRGAARFRVLSADDERKVLNTSVVAVAPGQHYRVTADIPASGITGNVYGNVVVRTSDKEMPILRVPYTIIVQARRPAAPVTRPPPSSH